MPLSSQCYIYSVGTDVLYFQDEKKIHDEMSRLSILKNSSRHPPQKWKKKSISRLLRKKKKILSGILDSRVGHSIVRELKTEALNTKSVIALFESSLTRACDMRPNELSECIIQIEFYFYQVMHDLIFNGFDFNGRHYVYFSSSAGSIRKHRGLFIEEKLYERIRPKLTCGLTIDDVNEKGGCVINKWLAYLALSSSATDVWEDFDIEKAIVCEDKEIEVWGDMDYINADDYSIERKYTSVGIPLNDGAGLMMPECGPSRVVRAPFIKGAMLCFDFQRFVREKCAPEQYVVYDIYGEAHNVIDEDIKYIFTRSQMKMAKYFPSWDVYKENFKKYGCEIGYCNVEQEVVSPARINYQMLNSLHDITDDEIKRLTRQTVAEMENIGLDYRTTMRVLGATEYNKEKSAFQEALMLYPELFRDAYSRDILKQTRISRIKQAKAGRLRINGYYRLVSPDLYAYCEWLFLGDENPKGLLASGEVAISQFRDGEELDCLRSPHLYFEHCLRKNNQSEEVKKWFDTKCVYTASNDLISRVIACDFDGDILLVTNDKTIRSVVNRNKSNYVPLLFDMKKAAPVEINSENIYNGLIAAFKYGKIGIYSNGAAKIWNRDEIDDDAILALKLLVAESNWSIDAAKCLYAPPRPQMAKELIANQTKGKLPAFFKYAKKKTDEQVEKPNNSAMNRIMLSIPDGRIKYCRTISKFDYRILMNQDYGADISIGNEIMRVYDHWKLRVGRIVDPDRETNDRQQYAYKVCRDEICGCLDYDVDYIVNTIVANLYTSRGNPSKKMLWGAFGDVIVENIKKNVTGKICPICGKRFYPEAKNAERQMVCSPECRKQMDYESKKKNRQK